MQQADASLELSALWRRVALLEEDNRQKSAQISTLSMRLDEIEKRVHDGNFLHDNSCRCRDSKPEPDVSVQSKKDSEIAQIGTSEPVVQYSAPKPPSITQPESVPPRSLSSQNEGIDHIDLTPELDSPLYDDGAINDHHDAEVGPNFFESDKDQTGNRAAISNRNVDIADKSDSMGKDNTLASQDALIRELNLQPVLNSLPEFLLKNLHRHQQIGAAFLGTVLKGNAGTIFADALGLGKTLQVLSALYLFWTGRYHGIAKPRLLIMAPLTVVPHWADEVVRFNSWLGSGLKRFSDPFLLSSTMSPSFRTDVLERWADAGGLLILSYSMFLELIGHKRDQRLLRTQPGPDVVVLDEGHRLCNSKSAIYTSLNIVHTKRRIVVSGYPLQNHLRELYALMNFVNKPKCTQLFKNKKQFENLYEKVINRLRTRKPDVSKKRAFVLYEMIRKNRLFFRRDNQFLKSHLPRKTEIVLTIRFSELQRSVWTSCLQKRNGLDGVTLHGVATMISDHPQIARRQVDLEADKPCHETLSSLDPSHVDLETSGKMVFLMVLLQQCRAAREKIVVFSRWIKALSFIEEMIGRYNQQARSKINMSRFDGSTAMAERESLIKDFNSALSGADCFLISTLCGEGISLVSASRVVILEPNWNPSIDFQAAYRVYRIGQSRPVFIYRLLMHEMFEDLVFQRQLEKIETANWVMDATDKDVANRVDTQWSEFIKEPPALNRILGPTHISLSDFALNDRITSSVINRLSLKSTSSFAAVPSSWIVSAVEHSKYFDDHAEIRQAPDLDSVMAFEELEYDSIYTHGTPARDSTLVDNVKRLTSISVEDTACSAAGFEPEDLEANHDNLIALSTTTASTEQQVTEKIPESCLKPIQPQNPNVHMGSGFSYQVVADVQSAEDKARNSGSARLPSHNNIHAGSGFSYQIVSDVQSAQDNMTNSGICSLAIPSDDDSWHAAVSLPIRSPDPVSGPSCDNVHPSRQSHFRRMTSTQNDVSATEPTQADPLKDANDVQQTSAQVAKGINGNKRRFEPVKVVDRYGSNKRHHARHGFNSNNSSSNRRGSNDDSARPGSSSGSPNSDVKWSVGQNPDSGPNCYDTTHGSSQDLTSSIGYSRFALTHRRRLPYEPPQHGSSDRSPSNAVHTRF